MANESRQIAQDFYTAFVARDFQRMNQHYENSSEFTFSDPIFPQLNYKEATSMWQMLLTAAKDLKATFEVTSDSPEKVVVRWQAKYTYSATGNSVTNHVESTLFFRNGKIFKQQDQFDLCQWTRQALGFAQGTIACYLPGQTIRPKAKAKLDQFIAKQNP